MVIPQSTPEFGVDSSWDSLGEEDRTVIVTCFVILNLRNCSAPSCQVDVEVRSLYQSILCLKLNTEISKGVETQACITCFFRFVPTYFVNVYYV
jgi:hypothetical protein